MRVEKRGGVVGKGDRERRRIREGAGRGGVGKAGEGQGGGRRGSREVGARERGDKVIR